MRQLLGRSHRAIGDHLSTVEIKARAREEAVHRETRFWYAKGAGWASGAQTLHSEGLGMSREAGRHGKPRLDSYQGEERLCTMMNTS